MSTKFSGKGWKWRLVATLFAALFLGTGCVLNDPDVLENADDRRVPVRVNLVINENGAATRAAGTDVNYNEDNNAGTSDERHVNSLRILVFSGGGNQLLKVNKLFTRDAADPESRFDYNLMSSTLTADFKLEPGDYVFHAVVNEQDGWGLNNLVVNTSKKSDYLGLASLKGVSNTITTEGELKTLVDGKKAGIPMQGVNTFNIDDNVVSNITNPVRLSYIPLTRTLAKVVVNLTNIDPQTNVIYPKATTYQIKSVSLKNVYQKYNVLESVSDAITETGGTVPGVTITHTRGGAFPIQRVLQTYMAERKSVTQAIDASTLEVVVDKLNEGEIIYSIPLYKKNADAFDYNIHRNHYYTINCYLNGSDMPYVEIFYDNIDWTLVAKQLFMGYGYNVEVDTDGNVTVSNTVQACDPHSIILKALNGAYFDTSATDKERTFTTLTEGTIGSLKLNNLPSSGNYLEVYYNNEKVKTFKK